MEANYQIISTKEARRLLGRKADGLSDAAVEDIITQLDFIATLAIKDYKRNQTKENKDADNAEK